MALWHFHNIFPILLQGKYTTSNTDKNAVQEGTNEGLFDLLIRLKEPYNKLADLLKVHCVTMPCLHFFDPIKLYCLEKMCCTNNNNLRTQEPRAMIFASHVCFSVLFDCGKFEMCTSFPVLG